jgi:ribosomal-protein-serine acetyltransferase
MFSFPLDDDRELRLIEERHTETLFALVQENHARLETWVPWLSQVATLESTRQLIKRRLQRLADNNGWTAGIWDRGELAGEIGFDYVDWNNRFTEIGYWVGAAFEGKGLVGRACSALVDQAFREMKLNRVQIRCAVENKRSRAIPEKLGFKLEGTLRGIERLSDRFVDLAVYGILAEEWEAVQANRTAPGRAGRSDNVSR